MRILSAELLLAHHPDTRCAVEVQAADDPVAIVRIALDLRVAVGAIAAIGAEGADPGTVDRVERLVRPDLPADLRIRLLRWLQAAGRTPDPAVLKSLLRGGDAGGRRAAVEGLANDLDLVDHLLVTVDLDGDQPYLDPLQPIGSPRLGRAAEETEETIEQVRVRYERLAPQFLLTLDWITPE